MIRCYSEIQNLKTFEDRYNYLRLTGKIGESTFGFDRVINQIFYRSRIWKDARNVVIIRDEGSDLGLPGYEIRDRILIHHMNPISIRDIERRDPRIIDPEFLICVSNRTHLAIHYGDQSLIPEVPKERHPGDTRLW